MAYNGLETDADMLRDYAMQDATSMLADEQVCYWAQGHLLGEPLKDKPHRYNLRNWLDEHPSDNEWQIYSKAYRAAMKAGIKVCDNVDFEDPRWEDDMDHESNIMDEAIEAAKAAVARLNK